MNIRGIQLLQRMGFSMPNGLLITKDLSTLDLDELYRNAKRDITIRVMDHSEPINQQPRLEKDEKKYGVPKSKFFDIAQIKTQEMLSKGVRQQDIIYMLYHNYEPEDIKCCGRVAMHVHPLFGYFSVDVKKGYRDRNTNFKPDYVYVAPTMGEIVFRTEAWIEKADYPFSDKHLRDMLRNVPFIRKNPHIDFIVYAENDQLAYHDLVLMV